MNEREFSDLKNQTLTAIEGAVGDEEMVFTTSTGRRYRLYHDQGCCESVSIEDICGDLASLLGSPLLEADEEESGDNPAGVAVPEYQDDSFTWTFYKLTTINGTVTIRWYGESNGYYSESVDFCEL
jgi:hypothetical protein